MANNLFVCILFAVILMLSPLSAKSAADPNQSRLCTQDSVKKILLPLYPDRVDSKKFRLAFKYKPSSSPNRPTVIFLAGGPGQGAIKSITTLPDEMGAVYIDPRGVDCSRPLDSESMPSDVFSSEYLAQDTIAVIDELKLKSVIVYGHSYGTLLATMVASKLLQKQGVEVRAVVLSGPLGRAYEKGEWERQFDREWLRVRSQMSERLLEMLTAKNPLGIAATAWGNFISGVLYMGFDPAQGEPLLNVLSPLETDNKEELATLAKKILASSEGTAFEGSAFTLYRAISCSEITPDQSDFILENGYLRFDRSICVNPVLTKPFDAGQWPLSKTSIFYISGELDPATPLWQSYYHFRSQPESSRALIIVKNAGHSAFWALKDCAQQIWSKIEKGDIELESILAQCQRQTSFLKTDAQVGTFKKDKIPVPHFFDGRDELLYFTGNE